MRKLITPNGIRLGIDNFLWERNGYRPVTYVDISCGDYGYKLKFTSYEDEIRAVNTEHNTDVCTNSCVEFFVRFDAENDSGYFNFEMNPNGAMYCSFRQSREDFDFVLPQVIDTFGISAKIFDDRWEVSYTVPLEFIRSYLPDYRHESGHVIYANFYKCGDSAPLPHYAAWNMIPLEHPDFHCPEFFGALELAF